MNALKNGFKEIKKLTEIARYEKNDRCEKPVLLMVGGMGQGKSSLGNCLIKTDHVSQGGSLEDFVPQFHAKESTEGVTKTLQLQEFHNIQTIDTVGFGDPDSERPGVLVMQDIINMLNSDSFRACGMSAIVQTVAVPVSSRPGDENHILSA